MPPPELHPYPCTQPARGCIGVGLPSSGSILIVGDLNEILTSPTFPAVCHGPSLCCAGRGRGSAGIAGPAPGQVEAAVRAGDPRWLHTCLSSRRQQNNC